VGGGFPPLVEVTCKFWDEEIALPGLGFITETEKVPADTSFPVALSCVEDTKLVASGAPARRTCAPLTNPLPLTVIANAPAGTDVGAMPVRIGMGFCKVTAPLPVAAESAELTARTVTVSVPGTAAGAVYVPDELIVPVAELPPATPFTCHITAELDEPATLTLKDCVAPTRTVALAGVTRTVTLDPEGDVFGLEFELELLEAGGTFVVPVHPASTAAASTNTNSGECRREYFLNFSIRKRTESTAYMRRSTCNAL
jgi:hypothetical protein